MEKVIVSQNKHWNSRYDGLYPREILALLIANLQTKHIQVLQGIRRSGKSTLFKLLINHLCDTIDPKEILYVNLDDPFFIKYANDPTKLYEVVQTAEKLTATKIKYFFMDEVQAIEGWERYVKSVYDSSIFEKLFITGSNTSLLNGKLATLLSGRYLSSSVAPLSFREIVDIEKIGSYMALIENLPKVQRIVDMMMQYGSFVEVYTLPLEFKRNLISTYYDTIILKDCVATQGIRDFKSFKELSFYLISNPTALYSYVSLAKAVGIHDKSVKEYVAYLEECYLVKELRLFSYSLKEQQNNKKKAYICDNGFLALNFSFSTNYGKLLENLVFTELTKAGHELYFYNGDYECDFIIKTDTGLEALQVCYELDDQNRKREIGAFEKLEKVFSLSKKTIITYNQEEQINDIAVVPFWKYFYPKIFEKITI